MFAKLWRWAGKDEIKAAEHLDDDTRLWMLKKFLPPKPITYIPVAPICREHCGFETVSDPDGDGIIWFVATPDGAQEWVDPLPQRVVKVNAYRYDARATFFNDDGTCPDHTRQTSDDICTRGITIKQPPRGEPWSEKILMAKLVKAIKREADMLRQIIEVQHEGNVQRAAGYRLTQSENVGGALVGRAIRCGECCKPPQEDA